MADFVEAKTLGEIVDKMLPKEVSHQSDLDDLRIACDLGFKSFPLAHELKDAVIDICSNSYHKKGDINRYFNKNVSRNDYVNFLEPIWDVVVENGLSFVIKDLTDRIVGVSLNFDAHEEPEVECNSQLVVFIELLEYLEGPIR